MLRARLIDYFRAGFYCHLTPGLNKMAEAALEAFQLWLRAVHTYLCVGLRGEESPGEGISALSQVADFRAGSSCHQVKINWWAMLHTSLCVVKGSHGQKTPFCSQHEQSPLWQLFYSQVLSPGICHGTLFTETGIAPERLHWGGSSSSQDTA